MIHGSQSVCGSISIHALLAEGVDNISIHALREEGDAIRPGIVEVQIISIHALREEGDIKAGAIPTKDKRFLSTPSARRATLARRARLGLVVFLSTPSARRAVWSRPPRGGRGYGPGPCWGNAA